MGNAMSTLPVFFLVAAALGVAAETVARTARFWIYHKPVYPVANVLVMFGLVMGTLAAMAPEWGVAVVTLIALLIGYAYEMANFRWLNWWYFPDDRFLVFRGKQACALAVACLWAAIPGVVHTILSTIE